MPARRNCLAKSDAATLTIFGCNFPRRSKPGWGPLARGGGGWSLATPVPSGRRLLAYRVISNRPYGCHWLRNLANRAPSVTELGARLAVIARRNVVRRNLWIKRRPRSALRRH